MDKEKISNKNKKPNFDQDETLEAVKHSKKQRQLKENNIQLEEMLEDLDDHTYFLLKNMK